MDKITRATVIAMAAPMLAACSPASEEPAKPKDPPPAQVTAAPTDPRKIEPVATEAPAGKYLLDKSHASLLFKVDHVGFSKYTSRFTTFDAELNFDPKNPAAMSVTATIATKSLGLENPPKGFLEELLGAQWLDAAKFPEIKFVSTAIELTGANSAKVTGDFTLHGVTKPLALNVTFNGGYKGHQYEPRARIGFSAVGQLKRSDFGISLGIPAPGTKMGVSDEVDIILEAEFSGPPLTP